MDKIIVVQPEKCTGCHTCELVCSFTHADEFNPNRSRISVFNYDKIGFSVPMLCQQCGVAACMNVCPTGAITRNATTGAMEVQDSKCIRCKMCTIACPFGATLYDVVDNIVAKCDLCGGDPACVKLCPSGAISYQEANTASLSKRKAFAAKFKDVFEEVG
ncbi:MAG: 4Fe-4S dicluster domain-containing protein [Syntrophomonas sp.]|nr:4Fe-4S dicluster domain-containing protein [Syntrophomonas sp.]